MSFTSCKLFSSAATWQHCARAHIGERIKLRCQAVVGCATSMAHTEHDSCRYLLCRDRECGSAG
jgi:hypothetical protein